MSMYTFSDLALIVIAVGESCARTIEDSPDNATKQEIARACREIARRIEERDEGVFVANASWKTEEKV